MKLFFLESEGTIKEQQTLSYVINIYLPLQWNHLDFLPQESKCLNKY